MVELFDEFPHLVSDMLVIKAMTEADLCALTAITENANVYRYIPPFLYRKSQGNLRAAIRNFVGRDFDKKRWIIAGIYQSAAPERLVGLAEIFDYNRRKRQVTIGYRINEDDWHHGIATETIAMLTKYLCTDPQIATIKAFVMPENCYSAKALEKNGFVKAPHMTTGRNWGGMAIVQLAEYSYQTGCNSQCAAATEQRR